MAKWTSTPASERPRVRATEVGTGKVPDTPAETAGAPATPQSAAMLATVEEKATPTEPVSAPSLSAPPTPATPSAAEIESMLLQIDRMAPGQVSKVARKLDPQLGAILTNGVQHLPGGGIKVEIELGPDLVPMLANWAESSGKEPGDKGLAEMVNELLPVALNAYLYGSGQ